MADRAKGRSGKKKKKSDYYIKHNDAYWQRHYKQKYSKIERNREILKYKITNNINF